MRFAQRVQAALLPAGPPKRLKGVELAGAFASARELGGDFHEYLAPDSNNLIVAVGDVSGKGVPAALYSAFAAELVRGRTFRRRYLPERSSPAGVLSSVNTILHQRQLEEYYCTLCYTIFDLKRRTITLANSGLPYPIRCSAEGCAPIELPGVPLGSFNGSTYDEVSLRAPRRRRVRLLHRRRVRGDECRRRGVHGRAAHRGGRRPRAICPQRGSSRPSSKPWRSGAAKRRRTTT